MCEDANNTVHLGFFVDDKADLEHLTFLEAKTASMCHQLMMPRRQKLSSLSGFLSGRSLTEAAYPSKKLRRFVADLIANKEVDIVYLFSAATFGWLPQNMNGIAVVSDLVDVDSAKWQAYSQKSPWPVSVIYKREAEKLFAFEKRVASASGRTFFVSDDEATLFQNLAGDQIDLKNSISGLVNGVDTELFNPTKYDVTNGNITRPIRLIFCGAMDYQPNIEAVCWFANNVFPNLRIEIPDIEFYIAGRPVAPQVQRLEGIEGITVTGGVPDMAEKISTADIVVAPLLTARGIQNKVLEGMAMAKPVVATSMANEGINAKNGEAIVVADDVDLFVSNVVELVRNEDMRHKIGCAARDFVQNHFSWDRSYTVLQTAMEDALAGSKKGYR